MRFLSFVFTSKERDEETGYGYLPRQAQQAHHGARYLDQGLMTMWLSVDPTSDKYPSISPYAYCRWNPIKLVNPDGNEAIENDDWYKDGEGRLMWNPTVTKETTLKDGGINFPLLLEHPLKRHKVPWLPKKKKK